MKRSVVVVVVAALSSSCWATASFSRRRDERGAGGPAIELLRCAPDAAHVVTGSIDVITSSLMPIQRQARTLSEDDARAAVLGVADAEGCDAVVAVENAAADAHACDDPIDLAAASAGLCVVFVG